MTTTDTMAGRGSVADLLDLAEQAVAEAAADADADPTTTLIGLKVLADTLKAAIAATEERWLTAHRDGIAETASGYLVRRVARNGLRNDGATLARRVASCVAEDVSSDAPRGAFAHEISAALIEVFGLDRNSQTWRRSSATLRRFDIDPDEYAATERIGWRVIVEDGA